METSRAVVLTGPETLELRRFPLPEIGPEDGLLKVELSGVCGSDPGIYRGKSARGPRPYPIVLGHEIVGRVVKLGRQAQRRHGVAEGDRVIVEYAFGCGQCRPCLTGRYTQCERCYSYGSMISCAAPPHLFGGYADYLYIHPRAMVHRVGDEISPEVGVLICAVLGNAVRWVRTVGGVSIRDAVVIVGPGPQGLAAVVAAKESGAGPILVVGLARDQTRLELALRLGADQVVVTETEDPVAAVAAATDGAMADLVIDVTGRPEGARTAVALAGTGAAVVLPGLYGTTTEVPLLLDQVVFKELRLLGVFSHDCRAVQPAIQLAREGKYPLADMISHRFPLERAEEALRRVGGLDGEQFPTKAVLDPAL